MSVIVDPLVDPLPPEVPLRDTPLVRVIAQLRFPEVLSVEQREFVAPFQEAIRSTYPVLRSEQTQGLLFGQGGVSPGRSQTAWRFLDATAQWRVTLTPDFLALETTKYASRSDFLERLKVVVQALDEHIEPAQVDRLGLRYIDRISGTALDEISQLIRPEVRGIVGTVSAAHAAHALTESAFDVENARVLGRWGLLPAGTTVDPTAIEPLQEKSWLLDLDMFSTAPLPFDVDGVVENAQRYAERIYTVFRWAVTDAFLLRYGAMP